MPTAEGARQEAGGAPGSPAPAPALVEAARRGEPLAQKELLAWLLPSVRRLAQALSATPADVEEVAQESLLRIFDGLPQFRGEARLATWAHRIVLNVGLMRARQQARRPWDAVATYGQVWETALGADGDQTLLHGRAMGAGQWALRPDEGAMAHQTGERIEAAVAALPERYRTVFVLREVLGHETDTVAEMLGLTLPTVKARLARARSFLRHLLASYRETNKPRRGGPEP